MFKDVQQLKLKDAEAVLEQIKAKESSMHDDVRALKDKLWNLENRLQRLEQQEKFASGDFRGKKFSVFERLITKHKGYRTYQNALNELKNLPDKIAALSSEIEIATMQADDAIAKSGILQEIENAQQAILNIERATTLTELEISPADAMNLLSANDIMPVLDESDCKIFERPRNYQSKADLIAVHKMDIVPTDSRLTTVSEAKVEHKEKVTLDGKEYEYSYILERNTMHVSMNDEVSSHMYGDWEHCHYVVLQPFADIPNKKIGAMMPNDTYTRGGIDLTQNAWILCPESEVETVKELNPRVHVLGYKSENAKGLAAPFLSQLGYRAEQVGQWGWADEASQEQFYQLATRENLHTVQHSASTDFEDEEFQIGSNKAIAIVKMLVKNDLIQSPADFERLKPQLEQVEFSTALSAITKSSEALRQSDLVDDVAVVANKRNIEVFAEKMACAGMPLSQNEITALQAQIDDASSAVAREMRKDNTVVDLVTKIMLNSAIRSHAMETERSL